MCSHRHGYAATGKRSPAGRILVCDDQNVYGFGRQKQYFNWTTPMEYRLFAESKKGLVVPASSAKKGRKGKGVAVNKTLWQTNVPILTRGLVLAGDTLFAAGEPDVLDETMPGIRGEDPEVVKATEEQEAALAGRRGGTLVAVSKTDGAVKYRYDLDSPPVFDGLIAANSRIYLALKDGTVQCWKGQ